MSKMGDLRSSANRASSHTGKGHKISMDILDRGCSGAILFRVKASTHRGQLIYLDLLRSLQADD
jgi:hypothetical protein